MKKLLAIALFSVFVSCTPGMHPEYEQNTETVKAFLKLQGEETDVNAQMALIHEELEWQPAFHGAAKCFVRAAGGAPLAPRPAASEREATSSRDIAPCGRVQKHYH